MARFVFHKIELVGYFFLFLVAISIDQLSKLVIREFEFFYVCNENASWGIDFSGPLFWGLWIFIVIWLVFGFIKKSLDSFLTVLVLAGAFSNAADRLIFGCVIDFLRLPFWPVFNLADILILFGVLGLLAKKLECCKIQPD